MFNHDITGNQWSNHLDVGTTHGHKIHYFRDGKKSACGHAELSMRKIDKVFVNTREYPLRRFCQTCIRKQRKLSPYGRVMEMI